VLKAFGRIDILVNNAGITQPRKTLDITGADYDAHPRRQPARHAVHVAGRDPGHARQRGGSIVCISSVSAQRGGGILGGPHYSAAKAGVLGLARAMAREFGIDGIRVNCDHPGPDRDRHHRRASCPEEKKAEIAKRPSRWAAWACRRRGRRLRVPRQRPVQLLHRHHARRERRHVDPLSPAASSQPLPHQETSDHATQDLHPHPAGPGRRPRCFSLAAQAQAVKLTLGHGAAVGNPRHEAAVKFAEVVKAKSGGRIEVQVAPSAAAGRRRGHGHRAAHRRAGHERQLAGRGGQRGARVRRLRHALPLLQPGRRPSSCWTARWARSWPTSRPTRAWCVLGYWDNGIRQMTNSKRAITKVEDMKGLKMRTPPDATLVDIMKALGAEAQQIKFAELYVALQQGVVDGQENPLMNIHASKLYEVQKHLALTNHQFQMTPFLMSKRSWDRCPTPTGRPCRKPPPRPPRCSAGCRRRPTTSCWPSSRPRACR
jgi:hypothetical protein